ncbi:hypothetical protein PMAYCL1PPCAC_00802, partial [Pristionchus mayeri]
QVPYRSLISPSTSSFLPLQPSYRIRCSTVMHLPTLLGFCVFASFVGAFVIPEWWECGSDLISSQLAYTGAYVLCDDDCMPQINSCC